MSEASALSKEAARGSPEKARARKKPDGRARPERKTTPRVKGRGSRRAKDEKPAWTPLDE